MGDSVVVCNFEAEESTLESISLVKCQSNIRIGNCRVTLPRCYGQWRCRTRDGTAARISNQLGLAATINNGLLMVNLMPA